MTTSVMERIESEIELLSPADRDQLARKLIRSAFGGASASDENMTDHPSIVRNPHILGEEPIIAGTRTPVRAIVELWREGLPPEAIPNRLPHLKLSQVFAALGFYSDHQQEINRYIEENSIPDELIDPLVRNL